MITIFFLVVRIFFSLGCTKVYVEYNWSLGKTTTEGSFTTTPMLNPSTTTTTDRHLPFKSTDGAKRKTTIEGNFTTTPTLNPSTTTTTDRHLPFKSSDGAKRKTTTEGNFTTTRTLNPSTTTTTLATNFSLGIFRRYWTTPTERESTTIPTPKTRKNTTSITADFSPGNYDDGSGYGSGFGIRNEDHGSGSGDGNYGSGSGDGNLGIGSGIDNYGIGPGIDNYGIGSGMDNYGSSSEHDYGSRTKYDNLGSAPQEKPIPLLPKQIILKKEIDNEGYINYGNENVLKNKKLAQSVSIGEKVSSRPFIASPQERQFPQPPRLLKIKDGISFNNITNHKNSTQMLSTRKQDSLSPINLYTGPPQESLIPHPPQESLISHPPQESLISHPPQESIIPHPPQESLIPHPPQESLISHPPQESLNSHQTQESLISQPPQESLISHPPQESLISHPPQESLNSPPPQESLIPHPPEESLIPHPPQESLISHPPDEILISHPPEESLIPHPPEESLIPHSHPQSIQKTTDDNNNDTKNYNEKTQLSSTREKVSSRPLHLYNEPSQEKLIPQQHPPSQLEKKDENNNDTTNHKQTNQFYLTGEQAPPQQRPIPHPPAQSLLKTKDDNMDDKIKTNADIMEYATNYNKKSQPPFSNEKDFSKPRHLYPAPPQEKPIPPPPHQEKPIPQQPPHPPSPRQSNPRVEDDSNNNTKYDKETVQLPLAREHGGSCTEENDEEYFEGEQWTTSREGVEVNKICVCKTIPGEEAKLCKIEEYHNMYESGNKKNVAKFRPIIIRNQQNDKCESVQGLDYLEGEMWEEETKDGIKTIHKCVCTQQNGGKICRIFEEQLEKKQIDYDNEEIGMNDSGIHREELKRKGNTLEISYIENRGEERQRSIHERNNSTDQIIKLTIGKERDKSYETYEDEKGNRAMQHHDEGHEKNDTIELNQETNIPQLSNEENKYDVNENSFENNTIVEKIPMMVTKEEQVPQGEQSSENIGKSVKLPVMTVGKEKLPSSDNSTLVTKDTGKINRTKFLNFVQFERKHGKHSQSSIEKNDNRLLKDYRVDEGLNPYAANRKENVENKTIQDQIDEGLDTYLNFDVNNLANQKENIENKTVEEQMDEGLDLYEDLANQNDNIENNIEEQKINSDAIGKVIELSNDQSDAAGENNLENTKVQEEPAKQLHEMFDMQYIEP